MLAQEQNTNGRLTDTREQTLHILAMSIRKLDESVVNRIAAGEIIIQPANALKEMLENSVDAQASAIEVLVKDGGLKLLQISDNGSGIDKEDLPLLCERFATSKLQAFEDLQSLSTYGFRGEALASISHISRMTVVLKTKQLALAYKAFFSNGKLANGRFRTDDSGNTDAKPVAGKDGTQITVEDLFYNVPARLKAFRLKLDEWGRILDVVGRYAVHCGKAGISCKKFGESQPTIATRPGSSVKERIRSVYGVAVAADLHEVSNDGISEFGVTGLNAAVTGSSYNNKKRMAPVFFINDRLVSCDPLRRALASVFQVYLPKGNYPFVYLSLHVDPGNVDVNIHPTKREVRFLHEDDIIEWVCGVVHELLSAQVATRTFKQSTLKRPNDSVVIDDVATSVKKYRQEHKLVRVDASQAKLSSFMATEVPSEESPWPEEPSDKKGHREYTEITLDSVKDLRQKITDSVNRPLTNVFTNLVFVGVVDAARRTCCFQYDVKLFLCDYGAVLAEFFYQVALWDFGNFGEYAISPVALVDILRPLYDAHGGKNDLVPPQQVVDTICGMADMFKEYFQLDFSEEKLSQLPILLRDVEPAASKLPYFIYRLGTKVDYTDEDKCLDQIAREIGLLYTPPAVSGGSGETEAAEALQESGKIATLLEHTVFPALRARFLAPESMLHHVVQVADLPGLYKVFERC